MDDFLEFEHLLAEPQPRPLARPGARRRRWERTPEGLLWETDPDEEPSAEIKGICQEARTEASTLESMKRHASQEDPAGAAKRLRRMRTRGSTWIDEVSNRMRPKVGDLSVRDLDLLNSCLKRVSDVIGEETEPQKELRRAIGRRLGITSKPPRR